MLIEQLILIVHLVLALAIIGLIMLQQGKGAEMGASFGAGASQTLFGSSGSGNVLTRATAWLAALFFASSFGLAVLAKQKSDVSSDIGINVPVIEEVLEDELPSAIDSEPAMELPGDDDLPLIPGVNAPREGADDIPSDDVPTEETGSGSR